MNENLKKVLTGAGLAALGMVLAYLATYFASCAECDESVKPYGPALAAIFAVLANALRKFALPAPAGPTDKPDESADPQ